MRGALYYNKAVVQVSGCSLDTCSVPAVLAVRLGQFLYTVTPSNLHPLPTAEVPQDLCPTARGFCIRWRLLSCQP
jgi:hypothetical protein